MVRQFFLGLLLALVLVAGVQPARATAFVGPVVAACNPAALPHSLPDESPAGMSDSRTAAGETEQSLQFDGIEPLAFALSAAYAGRPSIVWKERSRAFLAAPDPYPPRALPL